MPPSPRIIRHNGGAPPSFHSTVSVQKLRRLSALILVLRLASFCFSLAAAVFMATARSDSASWTHLEAFRFVLVANAIVALYSFVEIWFSVWENLKGETLFAEAVQVWFDFGHDQVRFFRCCFLFFVFSKYRAFRVVTADMTACFGLATKLEKRNDLSWKTKRSAGAPKIVVHAAAIHDPNESLYAYWERGDEFCCEDHPSDG
ncbi:hypothetical protein ACLOJK_012920 [Asimina triloba]